MYSESISSHCGLLGKCAEGPVVSVSASASMQSLQLDFGGDTISLTELKAKQQSDGVIVSVYHAVVIGCRPSRKEWAHLSNDSRVLIRIFGKLKVESGLMV